MRIIVKRKPFMKPRLAWMKTKGHTIVFPMSEGRNARQEFSYYLIHRWWFDNVELIHYVMTGSTWETQRLSEYYRFVNENTFLWLDLTSYDRDMSSFVAEVKAAGVPVGVRVKDGNEKFYYQHPVWLMVASSKQTFMNRPHLFPTNVKVVETLDGNFIDV